MKNDFLTLFYQSVKKYPDKTALQFFSDKLTYRELHELSDKVAIKIINQKIQRNSSVLLEVEKSLASVVYILGILKAGCYYIAVASNIPINRLTYLLDNSKCRLAFLHQYYDKFKNTADLNCFLIEKNLSKLIDNEEASPVNFFQPNPTDPACCLYTSGSTGNPKGVLTSHIGLVTFFEEIKPLMNMSHNSICLNTAPFIFDVSIIDTFFPLVMGATIHLTPDIILPNNILKMIDQHQITHMCGVSSTINLLFGNAELLKNCNISSLVTVMTGAELLHQKTLCLLLKYSPSATIINGYGLTETTCVVLAYVINTQNVNNSVLYPIGKPLPSIEAKILTNGSEEDRGELILRGDQVMLEYLNNPEANSKAFIEYEGKRYLKTGDIVSYDEEQNFIFHGRNDTQVKINGYRVDLNEVKYNILSMKIVKEAEVFIEQSTMISALSLNQTSTDQEELITGLKEELNKLLPKYMHPRKWIILENIPKLPTGKTDLTKLRTYFAGTH